MTPARSKQGSQKIHVALPPSSLAEQPADGLHALGEALKLRADDVLRRTVARTIESGERVDRVVQEKFERICAGSTVAVARWIAGEGIEVAVEAERPELEHRVRAARPGQDRLDNVVQCAD